jgi:hypothetical protein
MTDVALSVVGCTTVEGSAINRAATRTAWPLARCTAGVSASDTLTTGDVVAGGSLSEGGVVTGDLLIVDNGTAAPSLSSGGDASGDTPPSLASEA